MRFRFGAAAVVVAGLALGASPASATELVDDDGVQCPTATHTTIQSGVNAASVNEQVLVCNGTYEEQVNITGPAKNGVDVLAKVVRGAVIKAPSTPLTSPESLVYINNASGARIRRFIIAGPGPGTADSLRHGVLVENNTDLGEVKARVENNLIQDIRDSEAAANEEGIGVRVGRDFAGTQGQAVVLNNEIIRYQKGGVVVDGTNSFALVSNNIIRGLGPTTSPATPVPAQQGVQISRGAGADVTTNKISSNQYSGDTFSSFGVLVFNTTLPKDPKSSLVSRLRTNQVFSNDVGVIMQDAKNQLIDSNRVTGNGDASSAAFDGGIVVIETGANLGGNNRFLRNDARNNVGGDCQDYTTGTGTAGTGNTWATTNRGVDNTPPPICTP